MKHIWLISILLALLFSSILRADLPVETKEQRDQRMAWWREARFGMFIHWGLYAVPAGEWNGKKIGGIGEWIMNSAKVPVADYEKLQGQFNPVKFDAKRWVGIAKDAGMKYIVITSKHHDGFCLFDSKVSQYTIAHTPFKRDVLKELADACKEQGITLCFYHSIMDWHHPDAQSIGAPNYNGAPATPTSPVTSTATSSRSSRNCSPAMARSACSGSTANGSETGPSPWPGTWLNISAESGRTSSSTTASAKAARACRA